MSITKRLETRLSLISSSMELIEESVEVISSIIQKSISTNGKIMFCGNGGSAADSQHIAAELVGRYKTDRKGLAAIALSTDTSAITSISNDFGYDNVFERQIEALANEKDVVIGISTGGTSKNVINAIKRANDIDCSIIGFSGKDGGEMNNICDVNIVVPSDDTPRIQEMHILIGHTICHLIEKE